jgi:hypothetical protein
MEFRRRSCLTFGRCLWILLAATCVLPRFASAQELVAQEYKVKAAFLYNFAKSTEWPAGVFTNNGMSLVIGVLGRDPFGSRLAEITRGKTVEGRNIAIVHFDRVDQVRDCHLLFISASESGRMSSILAQLAARPILTVGDIGKFAALGGGIGLVKQEGEIHFEVNLDAVAAARLKLSSKLLRLADIVRPHAKGKKN